MKSLNPSHTAPPARVLIVDDERQNRQLLQVMLAPDGYLVQTAASGEEALTMIAQQRPDLILLDIMMPGMDGYQMAARVKSNSDTKNIPIVMITALDDRKAKMLGLNAGAEDFLTKPVDRAELCVRVRNLLRLKAYGDHVDRLEEVDQLKKGFLSTVSHQLRTPLTSIRGALGLLASGAICVLSKEAGDVVEIAERNAVRLMELINDILDLERLETGRIELRLAQVPVDSILRRATESLSTLGDANGVTVEAPAVAAMIWADGDRIVQVLVNLLSNAVKSSPPGGVVSVGVTQSESWVEFRVTDRGRGIAVNERREIFERFYQVDPAGARAQGGSGLGLAICKSIIEQHGGAIGVESEEGRGSSFWFRIAPSSQLFAPRFEQPILICGDRRGQFESVLREAGYAVIAESSDDAAWDLLQRTRVAAVLMKTDSALIPRLRKDPVLLQVPAILFADPAMLSPETLSDSLVHVLPQRVDSHDLLVALRDTLERSRAGTVGPIALVTP